MESEFKGFFAELGHPSFTIRGIVRLMLLKIQCNLCDEKTVVRWIEDPFVKVIHEFEGKSLTTAYFCIFSHDFIKTFFKYRKV